MRSKTHAPCTTDRNRPGVPDDIILQPDLFISYSHKDLKWLERLETALRPFRRDRKITLWSDRQTRYGAVWQEQIATALATARAAVLLVTQNFMASDFIATHELPNLLQAAAMVRLRILWIAASSSSVKFSDLAQYHALNDPSKPLDLLRASVLSKELARIAKAILAELHYQAALQSSSAGLGDEVAGLIARPIRVNALSDEETRNVLAIIHATFERPETIALPARVPSKALQLLHHLADLTDQDNLKQQIADTIAYVQTVQSSIH